MNGPGRSIAEEDLHAYVDGLLEDERRAAVHWYLQMHPDGAERVAAYGAQRQELRRALSALVRDPLPPGLNLARLLEARLRRRQPWRAAAAVLLVLGIGGAGGWLLGSRPVTGIAALVQEAAASYAVYASDPPRPVELGAAQRDDLARWLTRRLNRTVSPPDLSNAGYQLLGGRLVASPYGAAALFVYENGRGTRLTLYIRPMADGHTTLPEPADMQDMDGCVWIDQGVGYAIVAAEPYDRILELARQVRQEARSSG
jgi:anti-sigma factor RsiW